MGLQSLRAAEEAKHQPKEKFSNRSDNYTGTLKTVIKLNRDKKKGGRISSFKMTLQNSKSKGTVQEVPATEETTSKEPNEVSIVQLFQNFISVKNYAVYFMIIFRFFKSVFKYIWNLLTDYSAHLRVFEF